MSTLIIGAIGLFMEYSHKTQEITVKLNGEGYDIAQAFAQIQEPCTFVTGAKTGQFSEFLMKDAEENQIETVVEWLDDLTFTGSLRIEHKLDLIPEDYVSHPIYNYGISDQIIEDYINRNNSIIVEAGFKGDFLSMVSEYADEKPVFVILRHPMYISNLDFITAKNWYLFVSPKVSDLSATQWHKLFNNKGVLLLKENGTIEASDNKSIYDITLDHNEFSKKKALDNFPFLITSIINQINGWKRPMHKALADCEDVVSKYNEQYVDRQAFAFDRKFAAFFRTVEKLERDFLTGLKNRWSIEKEVDILLRQNSYFSLFLIDVDHFKKVNDTYGHNVGDIILHEMGKILADSLRSTDLGGRWGGEEFIAILPNTDIETAVIIAERIRKKIEETSHLPCKITASFGVSIYEKGENLKATVERSDKALYQAKNDGRNCVRINQNQY